MITVQSKFYLFCQNCHQNERFVILLCSNFSFLGNFAWNDSFTCKSVPVFPIKICKEGNIYQVIFIRPFLSPKKSWLVNHSSTST